MHTFRRFVVRYDGNRYKMTFSCLDQYLCMVFAQLTYRESCAISRLACAPRKTSSTAWASGAAYPEALWPTRTNSAIDASMQISLKR
jgi:hypothetical protein